jgi:hypothetical protein
MTMDEVFRYIDAHIDGALAATVEYCRLPTVSAQKLSIEETAKYTVGLLEAEGFACRILEKPTGGFPAGWGERQDAALLQPLRRAAAGPAGRMELAPVRASAARG